MEIISYLLGKNAGGGGGSSWEELGFTTTPESVIDGYDYALQIKQSWESELHPTGMAYLYQNNHRLRYMPAINIYATADSATSMASMFDGATALESVALFDTNKITSMNKTFYSTPALFSIPAFDTSNVTNMSQMIAYSGIREVPVLNTTKVTNFTNMFSGSTNLTDESLDNILQMCINATSYSGTKTLSQLGFNGSNYPASRIQALPHYDDFIDAGWTIGY